MPLSISLIHCLVFCLAASASAQPFEVRAAPDAALAPVRVLVEDDASPWSDSKGVGLANDLVRAAFAAAGAQAALAVVPYIRSKELVMRGSAPSCLSMSAAPELQDKVRFDDQPLFYVTARFYARKQAAATPTTLDQLPRGARVGIVHGYEYPQAVHELAARGVVLEATSSSVSNLRKLAAGRIDFAVVMTDPLRTIDLVERQAKVDHVTLAFSEAPQGSYIGFSSTTEEGERQRRLFNAGWKIISHNGKRAQLEAEWKQRCARWCPQ